MYYKIASAKRAFHGNAKMARGGARITNERANELAKRPDTVTLFFGAEKTTTYKEHNSEQTGFIFTNPHTHNQTHAATATEAEQHSKHTLIAH